MVMPLVANVHYTKIETNVIWIPSEVWLSHVFGS
jgi:hypothetical protein